MTESALKKINVLSEEQYQNAKANNILDENQMYLTPDSSEMFGKKILFQGESSPVSSLGGWQNVTLNDDINNYDFLAIKLGTSSGYGSQSVLVAVSQLPSNHNFSTYRADVICFGFNKATDNKNLRFTVRDLNAIELNTVKVWSVIGIKLPTI